MNTFTDPLAVDQTCLTLVVRTYQDAPPAVANAYCFDGAGGTIGRGPDNVLVLPDALKTVSRVHARIEPCGGEWWLTDVGSNPSRLNARPVSAGISTPLGDGDRLEIGAYVLDVSVTIREAKTRGARGASNEDVIRDVTHGATDDADDASGFAVMHDVLGNVLHGIPHNATDDAGDSLLHAAVLADTRTDARTDKRQHDPLGMSKPVAFEAFAGSEPDHVSPERFSFDVAIPDPVVHAVPAAHAARAEPVAAARATSIPDDYDLLGDRTTGATRVPADNVLEALCDGLGLSRSAASAHSPESAADFARLVARMLRSAVRGTVDVLLSRSVLKREIRLDTTLLLQHGNNPLKFFPDGDSALRQMLDGRAAGYLPAEEALAAAFDDIRTHELAVIAGMRAALAHLLTRFDPEAIGAAGRGSATTMTSAGSSADALVRRRGWFARGPSARAVMEEKAQRWDRFTQRYDEFARASGEDLQALCGNAFHEAYERYVSHARSREASAYPSAMRGDNDLE